MLRAGTTCTLWRFARYQPKKANKKNRPNDHRSVLLFYRAANSSGV